MVQCKDCSTVYDANDTREGRMPCPVCGSTARVFNEAAGNDLDLHEMLAMKVKAPGQKPHLETKSGHDYFRLTGTWSQLDRVIDKRNNQYYEHITDLETGEVRRHCEEPLDQHRGHGSAKGKQ
jgi:hypothetical protein